MLSVIISAAVSLGLLAILLGGMTLMLRQRMPQLRSALRGPMLEEAPVTPPAEINVTPFPARRRPSARPRAA